MIYFYNVLSSLDTLKSELVDSNLISKMWWQFSVRSENLRIDTF